MTEQSDYEALRLEVEELRRDNERLRAAWPKRRGCCCTFDDDGETLLSQCQAHIAAAVVARDAALEEAENELRRRAREWELAGGGWDAGEWRAAALVIAEMRRAKP